MREIFLTPCCAVLFATSVLGQQPLSTKPASKTNNHALELKDKVADRGMSMLQSAEADTNSLEGGMAAFGLMQVARGYAKSDKPKAIEILEHALSATRPIENNDFDGMGQRARLQWYIMRELVSLAPTRVDELLPQVDPEAREKVLGSLLSYYETQKQLDRAVEVLYRISAEKEMPYNAASRLISAIPAENNSEVLQIFTTAAASYRDHKEHQSDGDFPALIVTCKDRLPAATVREAVDSVFDQAEEDVRTTGGTRGTFAMSSPKGSASFGSLFEFRLFQLLPILQELDPAAAEKFLKQYPAVAAQLERYPLGARSLQIPQSQPSPQTEKTIVTATSPRWALGVASASLPSRMAEFSRASSIAGDAELNPADALAKIGTLTDPNIRCYALERIARVSYTKHKAVAKSATQRLVENVDSADRVDVQLMLLHSAVDLFLRMGDNDSAKATLERGFSLAAKAYKQDSNADQPNTALKAFWPSTNAYRWFCAQAARLSPEWALDNVGRLSDPDLKVLAEIAMAHTWLNLPESGTAIITAHKNKVDVLSFDR